MHSSLHTILLSCFFLFLSGNAQSQEAEEKALNDAFITLGNYNLGKIDSLPRNPANYNKLISLLDNCFKAFVLHPNSQDYVKFRLAKGSTNFKFFRLEWGVEVDAAFFTADSLDYVVFGYVTQDRPNYFIKRLQDSSIVYDGNGQVAYVNGIYTIEKNKLLLVEENGDHNSSRRVSVIDASGKKWKQLKAFRGNAFGQVKGNYLEKKFVDKRIYFVFKSGFETLMLAPQDANRIYFDEKKKILSYKRYTANNHPQIIEAPYQNGMFTIDDYNIADDISGGNTPMPY